MRERTHKGDYIEIKGIPGPVLKSPYPSFTKDYPEISSAQYIFCGLKPFIHCCHSTTLQEDWLARFSESFQEWEVLHISCTYLEYVHVGFQPFNKIRTHNFAYNWYPC